MLTFFGTSAVVAPSLYFLLNASFGDAAEKARALSEQQGVTIAYEDPASFRVPSSDARVLSADVQAENADLKHVSAALDGIERALAHYPRGFVSKLVQAVFICGVLHAGNSRAAGTVGDGWVLVAAPGYRSVYETKDMSAATFHHELSSLVLRRTGAIDRWSAFWPQERTPIFKPDEVLQEHRRRSDPASGFLSPYGTTNPENDFNVYAEEMFMAPGATREVAARHDIVRRKLQFVIERYVEVDSRMWDKLSELGYTASAAPGPHNP